MREEKRLSAKGSLVWKEADLGALSGCQYAPLWTKTAGKQTHLHEAITNQNE